MARHLARTEQPAGAAPSSFVPPFWLRGPHAQTLYAFVCLRQPVPAWSHERLELPDGDFVDVCHFGTGNGPRVCVFHGLEGCIHSHYVGGMIGALLGTGHRVSFMHFRGCSGEPNRLPRAYHSGDTGDIGHLIDALATREPATAVGAVGFSLGGNALLKYLGERGPDAPVSAAVAVSVPFDLDACARRIDQGFSQLYQAHLVHHMKASTHARAERLGDLPIDWATLKQARRFRDFDDCVTAPLHGFDSAADYYARASSQPWLGAIARPTAIIHAYDDPFVGSEPVPGPADVSSAVQLDLTERGGHVGFIAAGPRGRPYRWLDGHVTRWLSARLN